MRQVFCEKLIGNIEKRLRHHFDGNDQEMAKFADFDFRSNAAPRIQQIIVNDEESGPMLAKLADDPGAKLSAVREVLHLMADKAMRRISSEAARRPELVEVVS